MRALSTPPAAWALRLAVGMILAVGLAACAATPRAALTPGTPATEALPGAMVTPGVSLQPLPTAADSATPIPSATPTVEPTTTPSAAATRTPGPLIALDPGHGGEDVGARHFDAQGRMDFYESQLNLALALALRNLLEERGYRVLMTRDDDYGLNPNLEDVNGDGSIDHLDDLQTRIDLANTAGAELFFSIHQNAFEFSPGEAAPDVGGTVTFYCQDRPFGGQSRRFAELVHQGVLQAFSDTGYDIRDRGALDDLQLDVAGKPGTHLIVLGPESERIVRPSEMPGALSEPAFITHARESLLLHDPAMQARLAQAYANAIDAYFAGATASATASPEP